MKNKVAIIGFGYVGKAMYKIFPDAYIYDTKYSFIHPDGREELFGSVAEQDGVRNLASREAINLDCGLAIICVPTPMESPPTAEQNIGNVYQAPEFAPVDLSYIQNVFSWLKTPLVLLKSTVPPGTTDELAAGYKGKVCFSPEYVGEGKYQITPWKYMSPTDPRTHEFVIVGGEKLAREEIANYFVRELGPEKTYYLCDAVEAEIIKYMENSWGAMKVIFAQEFYDLCQKANASYIAVREGWALDNRVEKMHTAVFVDSRGFGGKCYPKDLNGIVAMADQIGVDMSLIKAVLRKNAEIKKNEVSQ